MRKLEEEKKCSGLSPVHVSGHLLGKISRGFGFCYLGRKLLHNSYSIGVKKNSAHDSSNFHLFEQMKF